ILCHGGNDFLRKLDTRETEANIRAMVKIARDRNIGVLLLATPKPGLMLSSPELYDKIGSELSIPVSRVGWLYRQTHSDDFIHGGATYVYTEG
ncbi:MAG: hypothetical protein ACKO15_09310, partial [Burkholderiales bacterium]